MSTDIVAIVTKDRPDELARTLREIHAICRFQSFLVVDSSDGPQTRDVCERFAGARSEVSLRYVNADPGTANQRNVAIETALEHPELRRLWWFDDDGEVRPGYREALEATLDADPRLGGAGGVYEDDLERVQGPLAKIRDAFKVLFLLHGREGAVLVSGRNIQVRYARRPRYVDWLEGGACVFVRSVIEHLRYDSRLKGASWGEDFDYSYRVSRDQPLVADPAARIHNRYSAQGRMSPEAATCTRIVLLHAWVNERPEMSVIAFWWSVLGEILLIGLAGVVGQRASRRSELVGLLTGVRICARGASSRDFEYGRAARS